MSEITDSNKKLDKRNVYIWIVVLLANISVVLAIGLFSVYEGRHFFNLTTFIALGIFLFSSIVPILISTGYNSNKLKNYYGYGIPALILLPIPYFIYDYYTCYSTFCEIIPIISIFCLVLLAIIFALFYTLGRYTKKLNARFTLFLILIEIIFLILLPLIYYFGLFCKWPYSRLNNSEKCYQRVAELLNRPSLCEKITYKLDKDDCYSGLALDKNNSEYCLKIKNEDKKNECYEDLENKKINDGKSKESKNYDSRKNYSEIEILSLQTGIEIVGAEINNGWKKFNDFENDFSVEYPIDWEVRANDQRLAIAFEESVIVGFSPRNYINYKNPGAENILTVKIYDASNYTVDQLIAKIHKDAINRTEERKDIKIKNIDALDVTIKYDHVSRDGSSQQLTYGIIYVQNDKKIYAMPKNGDYKYSNIFDMYYKSFKLL